MMSTEAGLECTLLIVDDDPVARAVLEAQLASVSIQTWGCRDALEAIVAIENANETIDAVIADFELPDMKGDQLITSLRGLCSLKGRAPLRVVVVSASFSDDSRQRCLEAGALAVLVKPVALELLLALLTPEAACVAPLVAQSRPADSTADLERLARRMRCHLGGQAGELLALCSEGDHGGVARLAHQVAGTAAMLGWSELQRVALVAEMRRMAI